MGVEGHGIHRVSSPGSATRTARELADRARGGRPSDQRLRHGGVAIADCHGNALSFPEHLNAGLGQPDSTSHAHAAPQRRDRSCRRVDWYQMDLRRACLPADASAEHQDGDIRVSVFGWSRGYVGFRTAYDLSDTLQATVAVVSTYSADGLHWTVGRPMDVEGLPDPSEGVAVTQVLEGPSGLLAVGEAFPPLICGGPPTVYALWTSTDGLTWTRVQPPADFASASVYTVDAGSTGYIASGTLKDGVTQAVWLSGDGRSWRQVPLTKATFGKFVVDGATDFAAGYVVSGTVVGDQGCGGGADLFTPSLWWSADGTSWTRSKLTGAAPAATPGSP